MYAGKSSTKIRGKREEHRLWCVAVAPWTRSLPKEGGGVGGCLPVAMPAGTRATLAQHPMPSMHRVDLGGRSLTAFGRGKGMRDGNSLALCIHSLTVLFETLSMSVGVSSRLSLDVSILVYLTAGVNTRLFF